MHQPNKHTNEHRTLFKWACRGVKYFFLFLVGLSTVLVLSVAFGLLHVMMLVLTPLFPWIVRFAAMIFCFLAVAIVLESLR